MNNITETQIQGVKNLSEIYLKIPPINLYSIREVYTLLLMRLATQHYEQCN